MKKDETRQLNDRTGWIKNLDKMSMHFVVPLVLFYLVIGLLLILLNDLITHVAAWALAVGLMVTGGWLLLRYFRSDTTKRLAGADLAAGMILLLAGILLVCSPDDMKEVFPKIWGLSLIFGGFLKVQYAFDEKSVHVSRWWIMLFFAVASLAIGILALLNKSVFGDDQHLVIGIFMLGEAVLDLVTYFLLSRGMKKLNSQPIPVSVPAPVQAPAAPAEPLPGEDPGTTPEQA